MKANEVKLGDTVYQLGCNLRTRIMYEKMCGKFFGEEMMTFEQVVFFFCSLTTTNDNFQMDLESFMDLLSADETPMNDFFQWEISYFKEVASLSGKESKSNDKKRISAAETYQLLVMEGGLPPDYVMDRMQPYEIEIALEGLHLKHKELWEATRMVMYTIAQVNSRSTIDPKELLRLPWDEGVDMEDSADHYEEMKKEMSNILKQMNNASGFSDQALAEESGV